MVSMSVLCMFDESRMIPTVDRGTEALGPPKQLMLELPLKGGGADLEHQLLVSLVYVCSMKEMFSLPSRINSCVSA